MKISIAMTTYNGSKHIKEQLSSIKCQTLQPDEVIICDDVSHDDTIEIVSKFTKENNLENWHLICNDQNLGWKRNFRKAIGLTHGDIIFFSDQDDIWLTEKIEYMTALMTKYDMGCLYGESIKIDDDGKLLEELNSVNHFTDEFTKIKFTNSFYTVGGLGCCMCVKRRVADKYLELEMIDDDHDSQCPRIAVLYDSLWRVNKAVIKYRIYPGNTSGISDQYSFGTSNVKQRIEDMRIIRNWLNAVINDGDAEESRLKNVEKALKALDKRGSYLEGNRTLFFELIPLYKYYSGMTMLIGDFAYKHKLNIILGKIRWKISKIRAKLKTLD